MPAIDNLIADARDAATGAAIEVTWRVDIDGAVTTSTDNPLRLVVPASANSLVITGTPKRTKLQPLDLHPHSVSIGLTGNNAPTFSQDASKFRWDIQLSHSRGARIVTIHAFFSLLQDVTARAAAVMAAGDPAPGARVVLDGFDRAPSPLPTSWSLPPVNHHFLDPHNPVTNDNFNFVHTTVDPRTEDRVFALAGHQGTYNPPPLIAVSWPRQLLEEARLKRAAEPSTPGQEGDDGKGIPFLAFFGPAVGEFSERMRAPRHEPEFHWDWIFFQFWRTLNYQHDPVFDRSSGPTRGKGNFDVWTAGGGFGIPYQVALAGKPVVTVVPMHGNTGMAGMFATSAGFGAVLTHLTAFVAQEVTQSQLRPHVGRVAVSGWSWGNTQCTALMSQAVAGEPFVTNHLREVYFADPGLGNQVNALGVSKRWTDGDARRKIFFYTSEGRSGFDKYGLTVALGPSTVETVGPHIFVFFTIAPFKNWAAQHGGATMTGGTEPHFLMPSLVLGHALAHSDF